MWTIFGVVRMSEPIQTVSFQIIYVVNIEKESIPVQKDSSAPQQCSVRAGQQCMVSFTATHFLNESAVIL